MAVPSKSIKVEPFASHTFGAVIKTPVSEILKSGKLQRELINEFNKHSLLILPQQPEVSPAELLSLSKMFPHCGENASVEERCGPWTGTFRQWKLPKLPEIQVQGWGKVTDFHGVSGIMNPKVLCREWHTDGVHELYCPPVLTAVHCIKAPPIGGETLFASGYEAWEALSKESQEKFGKSLVRYHSNTNNPNRMSSDGTMAMCGESNVLNGPDGDEYKNDSCRIPKKEYKNDSCRIPKKERDQNTDMNSFTIQGHEEKTSLIHPLFRRHPISDRKALYVAPLWLDSIDNYSFQESSKIVSDLMQPAVEAKKMYAHRYNAGDIILWDNRCLLHSASPCEIQPPPGTRLILRIRMASKEIPQGA